MPITVIHTDWRQGCGRQFSLHVRYHELANQLLNGLSNSMQMITELSMITWQKHRF